MYLTPKYLDSRVDNIASHIQNAQTFLQERAIKQFGMADKDYGAQLRARINYYNSKKGQPTSAAAHI